MGGSFLLEELRKEEEVFGCSAAMCSVLHDGNIPAKRREAGRQNPPQRVSET